MRQTLREKILQVCFLITRHSSLVTRHFFPRFALSVLFLALAAPASSGTIALPSPQRVVLQNGLIVLILPQDRLPLVVCQMVIRAGSAADPDGQEGLAALTANLVKKGAGTRTVAQVADDIEFRGGTLQVESQEDATTATAHFLSRDTEAALSLLADVIIRPTFADEEVEREREQALTTIVQAREEPDYLADLFYDRVVFGPHPYGRPPLGTEASVAALTRSDIVAFHRLYYVPNNAFLVIVGDVQAAAVIQRVRTLFGAWTRRAVPLRRHPPADGVARRRVWLIDKPDLTQSQVRMGNLGIPRNHPDYFPILVANTVFGDRYTSRLMNEIRVRRGLTYSIASAFAARQERGAFIIRTFTKSETTGEIIEAILAELKKFRDTGVSEAELASARQYLMGLFPLRLEGPEAIATQLAGMELYRLPADYLRTYAQRVQSVTQADVLRVARQYFAYEALAFVVLGNAAEVRPQVERFGPVEQQSFKEEDDP